MKVVFATPFLDRPTAPFIEALEACLPAIEAAGWQHKFVQCVNNPYISGARAEMTRKALDAEADVVVYLDYDISFTPEDMVKLLEAEGGVVAGTYRFKNDVEEYMVSLVTDPMARLVGRPDGCLKTEQAPAGFLKVTKQALSTFAKHYPQLLYGDPMRPSLDLFNHGAIDGTWYGEDYSFCRRWIATGNDVWLIPDLNINHHSYDRTYEGNFHKYLLKYNEEHSHGTEEA